MQVVFYKSAHFMYLWSINSVFAKCALQQNTEINTLIWCIVYIQSMTLFLTIFQGSLMAKCHWPKSMTHGHKPDVHNQTVIDQSMTIFEWAVQELSLTSQWHFFCDSPPIIQELSLTGQWHFFCNSPLVIRPKTVIDRSMTLFLRFPTCNTIQNCHWPVNNTFSAIPHL